MLPFENAKLLPKSKVFEEQVAARAKEASGHDRQKPQQAHHETSFARVHCQSRYTTCGVTFSSRTVLTNPLCRKPCLAEQPFDRSSAPSLGAVKVSVLSTCVTKQTGDMVYSEARR